MNTYSETVKKKPIDWWDRIRQLREGCSQGLLEEWDIEAASWVTCAVGNQCSVIPRDIQGVPLDEALKGQGVFFSRFWERAQEESSKWPDGMPEEVRASLCYDLTDCLNEIEQRSAELILEMNTNDNNT